MATNNKHIDKSEKLIEEVRNFKLLYDTNDENYIKSKLKDGVWRDIAKKLNLEDGNEAKTAWLKLRNCHRDALRRQKKCIKSGVPATAIKLWRYQKQMNFLLPFMANREREGYLEADSDTDDNEENLQGTQDVKILKTEEPQQQTLDDSDTLQMINEMTESNQEEEPRCSSSTENKNIGKRLLKEQPSTAKVRKIKKTQKDDTSTLIKTSVLNYEKRAEARTHERKKLEENSELPDDHLYHFFMSMYQITKKMPFSYQHTVRNNVYNIVSRVEANCFGFQDHSYESQSAETSSLYLYRRSASPQAYPSYSSSTSPLPSPNCDNNQQLSPQTPQYGQEFVTVLLEDNEGDTQ